MFVEKRGRPRKIEPNSLKAKLFLDLYLDPLESPEQIIKKTGIGLSTFYNWENELGLSKINMGLAVSTGLLPKKRALQSIKIAEEIFELELLRKIAKSCQIRMNIVPVNNMNGFSIITPVLSNELDGAIGSISQTSERKKNLNFSINYLVDDKPSGYIYRSKIFFSLKRQSSKKPTLGAVQKSVHEEHALNGLQQDYIIRSYRDYFYMLDAVASGRIDYALFHPAWLHKLPQFKNQLEVCSQRIFYKSETGIIFNSSNDPFREVVNSAIEQFLNNPNS
jgi:hypothetical protein